MIFTDGGRPCIYRRFFRLHSGIWVLVAWLTMAGAGLAFGQPPSAGPVRELRAGLLAHDVDGLWSGESSEKGPDFCMAVIFNRPLFNLMSATAYPSVGGSWNTRGDTSAVYGGVLLQWEPASAFFFSTGIGLALHDGERDTEATDRKSLGSRVLFRIPIEIGYAISRHHRIVLAFDHVSNADLASPNEGMDSLGLVYGYRF